MHQKDQHHRKALRRVGESAGDLSQVQPATVQQGGGFTPCQDFLRYHFQYLSCKLIVTQRLIEFTN